MSQPSTTETIGPWGIRVVTVPGMADDTVMLVGHRCGWCGHGIGDHMSGRCDFQACDCERSAGSMAVVFKDLGAAQPS